MQERISFVSAVKRAGSQKMLATIAAKRLATPAGLPLLHGDRDRNVGGIGRRIRPIEPGSIIDMIIKMEIDDIGAAQILETYVPVSPSGVVHSLKKDSLPISRQASIISLMTRPEAAKLLLANDLNDDWEVKILLSMPDTAAAQILQLFPTHDLFCIFGNDEMPVDKAAKIIGFLGIEKAARIIRTTDHYILLKKRASIFELLPEQLRLDIMKQLEEEDAVPVLAVLGENIVDQMVRKLAG